MIRLLADGVVERWTRKNRKEHGEKLHQMALAGEIAIPAGKHKIFLHFMYTLYTQKNIHRNWAATLRSSKEGRKYIDTYGTSIIHCTLLFVIAFTLFLFVDLMNILKFHHGHMQKDFYCHNNLIVNFSIPFYSESFIARLEFDPSSTASSSDGLPVLVCPCRSRHSLLCCL
jgi:hypothetical protein